MAEFQVLKSNLLKHRIIGSIDQPEPGDAEVVVKINQFAFTANNVTYGVAGDRLGYWQFFPAAENTQGEWGILPVWGFADVVASHHNDVAVGERLFGYFPTAEYLVMKPVGLTNALLHDGVEHRAQLPAGYNQYRRVNNEPKYDRAQDARRSLLFPLHITSFSLFDQLSSNDWYGAQQIIIVSASSKTSTGLAYGLKHDKTAPPLVGITSKQHVSLVEQMSAYDTVISYDDLDTLNASRTTVIVDMSGNRKVLGDLHAHLQQRMVKTINVGMTHWDSNTKSNDIISERSEMFFAPSHIQARVKEWGPEEFGKRSGQFMLHVAGQSSRWLQISERDGLSALQKIYVDVAQGRNAPDQGLIIKM